MGGWAGGGLEQVHPRLVVVPAVGQVQGDVAAAVAGDAGGDVDEVGPDGGAAGFGVAEAGQRPGGAQQVVADRGACEPGGVGGERAGGQVGERAVGPVGEDLLGLGVATVVLLGLDELIRRVGEDGVVPPGGEQLALPGGRGVAVEVTDAADDEPGGYGLPLLRGERGVFRRGDLGVRTQQRSWSSQMARG